MPITFQASPSNCINPWANKRRLGDFFSNNYYVIWKTANKKKTWVHLAIGFGIRRSDQLQWWPFRNTSHNRQKALMIGFWKFYLEVMYRY